MTLKKDDLSIALEALRDRPIVTESRDYAVRWERTRARAAQARGRVLRAAGALVVSGAIAGFALLMFHGTVHSMRKNLVETTNETLAVALEDGSRIVLDRSSRLRVAYSSRGRDIELLDGQAHFEVARDARRAFRVHTNSAVVVAVGTTFDVAALPSRTRVTLIEGRVNVSALSAPHLVQVQVKALSAGEQLEVTADGQVLERQDVNVENVTAWQRGMVVIDDQPLPDALEVMNRYSPVRIVVQGGPALQSRRVSGVFRVGDVETEAIILQKYFGLRETARTGSEIVLAR